jgi:crossover junction endodeoxyribonuclease RuvC
MVLGIDPGLGTTGWAVIEGTADRPRIVEYGVVRTRPAEPMPERLLAICQRVQALLTQYRPENVVIEDVFLARDTKAALALGQARGAAMLAAALSGVEVFSYTALQVKQSVTGNGHASKEQVAFMVRELFHLRQAPEPADCADAAAIALCHIHRHREPVATV